MNICINCKFSNKIEEEVITLNPCRPEGYPMEGLPSIQSWHECHHKHAVRKQYTNPVTGGKVYISGDGWAPFTTYKHKSCNEMNPKGECGAYVYRYDWDKELIELPRC